MTQWGKETRWLLLSISHYTGTSVFHWCGSVILNPTSFPLSAKWQIASLSSFFSWLPVPEICWAFTIYLVHLAEYNESEAEQNELQSKGQGHMCVCLFIQGYMWEWHGSRDAIVQVFICISRLTVLYSFCKTCWLTEAADSPCPWHLFNHWIEPICFCGWQSLNTQKYISEVDPWIDCW